MKLASRVLLIFLTFTGGCTFTASEGDRSVAEPAPPQPRQQDAAPSSAPSLAELMMQRQQLCSAPREERLNALEHYRDALVGGARNAVSAPAETVHQLHALMLASCEPARTPGIFSEMLALITDGDWTPEYMAFFDLLVASHRAYVLLDGRHQAVAEKYESLVRQHDVLRKDYQALEEEHQKTIKGISDIERGTDLPSIEDLAP